MFSVHIKRCRLYIYPNSCKNQSYERKWVYFAALAVQVNQVILIEVVKRIDVHVCRNNIPQLHTGTGLKTILLEENKTHSDATNMCHNVNTICLGFFS